jgi:hypothetical protein
MEVRDSWEGEKSGPRLSLYSGGEAPQHAQLERLGQWGHEKDILPAPSPPGREGQGHLLVPLLFSVLFLFRLDGLLQMLGHVRRDQGRREGHADRNHQFQTLADREVCVDDVLKEYMDKVNVRKAGRG